jgi:general secretion pathway protein A
VLLELADARRFAARALFLGIDAQAALLATERGVTPVPLAELAEAWTGGFRYYWQPPRGWQGAVGEGDSGPSVTAIAGFFARLDDQDRPLAKDRFTAALAQRVRLYQAGRGLTADGVVGEQTLRALVLDAGADLSRSAARERIAARVVAGQWP